MSKKNKTKEMERRTFNSTIELRDLTNEKGEVTGQKIRGYAVVFESDSENMGFIERIAPTAFANTDLSDVRALYNHDPNYVLGRTKSGTLQLRADEKGLFYEIDPPDNAFIQALVMDPISRGDISNSSFGFIIGDKDDSWEERSDGTFVRTIHNIPKLYDVSPVTFPAYSATEVTVRSFDSFQEQRKEQEEEPQPQPEPTPDVEDEQVPETTERLDKARTILAKRLL